MGKDYIPVVANNLNLKEIYNKLFTGPYEIIEASNEKWFRRIPMLKEIREIELGTDGTKETVLRLKNNDFVVINKTIEGL